MTLTSLGRTKTLLLKRHRHRAMRKLQLAQLLQMKHNKPMFSLTAPGLLFVLHCHQMHLRPLQLHRGLYALQPLRMTCPTQPSPQLDIKHVALCSKVELPALVHQLQELPLPHPSMLCKLGPLHLPFAYQAT